MRKTHTAVLMLVISGFMTMPALGEEMPGQIESEDTFSREVQEMLDANLSGIEEVAANDWRDWIENDLKALDIIEKFYADRIDHVPEDRHARLREDLQIAAETRSTLETILSELDAGDEAAADRIYREHLAALGRLQMVHLDLEQKQLAAFMARRREDAEADRGQEAELSERRNEVGRTVFLMGPNTPSYRPSPRQLKTPETNDYSDMLFFAELYHEIDKEIDPNDAGLGSAASYGELLYLESGENEKARELLESVVLAYERVGAPITSPFQIDALQGLVDLLRREGLDDAAREYEMKQFPLMKAHIDNLETRPAESGDEADGNLRLAADLRLRYADTLAGSGFSEEAVKLLEGTDERVAEVDPELYSEIRSKLATMRAAPGGWRESQDR